MNPQEVTAYIALGTNVGERKANLDRAISLIAERCGSISKLSSVYETSPIPVSGVEQGSFYNMVLELVTAFPASDLMQELHSIESELGRDRSQEVHWGPRTLDLDLISYGKQVSSSNTLTLPHSHFHERDFVLLPLQEINSNFIDPRTGSSIGILVKELDQSNTTIIRKIH